MKEKLRRVMLCCCFCVGFLEHLVNLVIFFGLVAFLVSLSNGP